jgi:hypothetical protein
MAAMGATVLVVSGVAYALSVQCDGVGDQDPDPGECWGTDQNDVITGSQVDDNIVALDGRDEVSARGGDDLVGQGAPERGRDDISGGVGGDGLFGGRGPDDIDGGPGTTDASEPRNTFECNAIDSNGGIVASTQGTQNLFGEDGNDDLDGGRDNDFLRGGAGTNDHSGNRGSDCIALEGDENERASGGDGDDIIFADETVLGADTNGDDVFCGAGIDAVVADAEDRVAANCEVTTPEGTLR